MTVSCRTVCHLVVLLACTLIIAGCGGGNSTLSTTPTTTASVSVSSLTFSSTTVSDTSAAQTVTLTDTGSTTLSGISVVIEGTDASSFGETTTCTTTLASNATCTISVTFTPTAVGTATATLNIADNASNSPQTVTLTGTGAAAIQTPTATLSVTSLTFASTVVGNTAAAQSFTLSNTGTGELSNIAISITGTNAAEFSTTSATNCGTTLAADSTCTIAVAFAPTATGTAAATLSIADNASGSPQTVTLSGTGAASGSSPTVTYTLYTFPESDNSVTPLYALINNAKTSIDMTMYALEDTTFVNDLVAACKRGVTVRVILDVNDEQSGNTPAYTALNAQTNCSAVWANTAFEATHEKAFVIDGTTIAVMSLNLQTQYYSTTRDFAEVYNDPADIAAFEGTFNADYAAGTPAGGTQGASDFSYQPSTGTDLIWSPTTAQAAMEGIINGAQSTLVIENEELLSSVTSTIVADLVNACKRGVNVELAMVDESDDEPNFDTLVAAGCGVHTVPDTSNGFYIHAKAVVADYGLSTQKVYMGSINYSNASMNDNRELGMYITDPTSVTALETTMSADYATATAWQ